jgi:hypothetical protein
MPCSHGSEYEMAVFWVVVLFSLIETEAYFIGIRRPDDGRGKDV